MRTWFYPLLALVVVWLPGSGQGASVVERSIAERAKEADRVALVQVLSRRTEGAQGDPRRLRTVTTVTVGEYWKGTGPSILEVVQLGGRYGPWESHVPGDAVFTPGETALLLLRCRATEPNRCTLMALGEGKLRVEGPDAWVFSLRYGTSTRRSLASVRAEIAGALEEYPGAPSRPARRR